MTVLPGSTIGILGSGQLGRMLALSARTLGYRVHTFSPDIDSPTGMVADREVSAAYDDLVGFTAAVSGFLRARFPNVQLMVSVALKAPGSPAAGTIRSAV